MDLWQHITDNILASTGVRIRKGHDSIGGGCINQAVRVQGEGQDFFVKLNDARRLSMFEAEAEGLKDLANTGIIRVPLPVCLGTAGGQAYLVLEYLPFGARGKAAELGRQLAALHRVTAPEFGWRRENTIGSTPQINVRHTDWLEFWRDERLGYQLEVAARNGYGGELARLGDQLQGRLDCLFESHRPQPSLLHGDLWSGNYGFLNDGSPVIFDPAVYYGDREADIAMTELFGGFGADFYAAYREAWPLDAGYSTRRTLYNLYHILNHMNMFGGGYQSQALGMMRSLLAETA